MCHFGPELFLPNFNMVGYKQGFIEMDGQTDGCTCVPVCVCMYVWIDFLGLK